MTPQRIPTSPPSTATMIHPVMWRMPEQRLAETMRTRPTASPPRGARTARVGRPCCDRNATNLQILRPETHRARSSVMAAAVRALPRRNAVHASTQRRRRTALKTPRAPVTATVVTIAMIVMGVMMRAPAVLLKRALRRAHRIAPLYRRPGSDRVASTVASVLVAAGADRSVAVSCTHRDLVTDRMRSAQTSSLVAAFSMIFPWLQANLGSMSVGFIHTVRRAIVSNAEYAMCLAGTWALQGSRIVSALTVLAIPYLFGYMCVVVHRTVVVSRKRTGGRCAPLTHGHREQQVHPRCRHELLLPVTHVPHAVAFTVLATEPSQMRFQNMGSTCQRTWHPAPTFVSAKAVHVSKNCCEHQILPQKALRIYQLHPGPLGARHYTCCIVCLIPGCIHEAHQARIAERGACRLNRLCRLFPKNSCNLVQIQAFLSPKTENDCVLKQVSGQFTAFPWCFGGAQHVQREGMWRCRADGLGNVSHPFGIATTTPRP
eukprot:m.1226823 g.1226823  ORF g.1226823 m.1226823 type:complete len:488 (-) comp24640_c0_seq5:1503-2966(-)